MSRMSHRPAQANQSKKRRRRDQITTVQTTGKQFNKAGEITGKTITVCKSVISKKSKKWKCEDERIYSPRILDQFEKTVGKKVFLSRPASAYSRQKVRKLNHLTHSLQGFLKFKPSKPPPKNNYLEEDEMYQMECSFHSNRKEFIGKYCNPKGLEGKDWVNTQENFVDSIKECFSDTSNDPISFLAP